MLEIKATALQSFYRLFQKLNPVEWSVAKVFNFHRRHRQRWWCWSCWGWRRMWSPSRRCPPRDAGTSSRRSPKTWRASSVSWWQFCKFMSRTTANWSVHSQLSFVEVIYMSLAWSQFVFLLLMLLRAKSDFSFFPLIQKGVPGHELKVRKHHWVFVLRWTSYEQDYFSLSISSHSSIFHSIVFPHSGQSSLSGRSGYTKYPCRLHRLGVSGAHHLWKLPSTGDFMFTAERARAAAGGSRVSAHCHQPQGESQGNHM